MQGLIQVPTVFTKIGIGSTEDLIVVQAECEGRHAIAYAYHGLGWHGP